MITKSILFMTVAWIALINTGLSAPVIPEPELAWSAKQRAGNSKPIRGDIGFQLTEKVSYREGKPSVFVFDGDGKSEGAILLGKQEVRKNLPKKDITIEAWVKIKQPLKWGGILSTAEDNGSYERGFILGFHEDTFYWGVTAMGTNPIKLTYLDSGVTYVPNSWYHVVATYDGKLQKIYVDGKLAASSLVQRGDIEYADKFNFSLGGYWDQNEKYASNMELESLALWDRSLSGEMIAKRFEDRKGEFPGISGQAAETSSHKDWPSYKRDNQNSAHYPHKIPKDYHLQWSYQPTKPPKQAWPGTAQSDWWRKRGTPEPEKATFDKAFELVAAEGLVYFGSSSDDHVYCLEQATGKLKWKFTTEGPVRLAPTIHHGMVLVGSDDGSVYCLGAADGSLKWRTRLPQVAERKLAGNGRMISLYPVRTNVLVQGNLAHFGCGLFPKNAAAWYASVNVGTGEIITQKAIQSSPQGYMEERNGKLYTATGRHPAGAFLASLQKQGKVQSLAAVKIPQDYQYAFITTENYNIGGGYEKVALLDSANGNEVWSAKVKGIARSIAVSDDQILVSTDAGVIYCYGGREVATAPHYRPSIVESNNEDTPDITNVLSELPSKRGYALMLDTEDFDLIAQLARQSELQVIVVGNDEAELKELREWLWDRGLSGQVVAHRYATFDDINYTKRSFNLILARKRLGKEDLESLKPYVRPDTGIIMTMEESEPAYKAPAVRGAGSWTHMYGNPGNTACSGDENVGSRLALQWFGRPGPEHIMDRHLRPPPPLVHQGIMIVPGRNYAIGVDTWNGTILWEKPIENFQRIGAYRDSGNMVLTDESVYCLSGSVCLKLNVHTGVEENVIKLPVSADRYEWGYVGTVGADLGLIGSTVKKGSVYRDTSFNAIYENSYGDNTKVTCSDSLFASDRNTGKKFWLYSPDGAVINPTITLNSKSVIFIESGNEKTLQEKTSRLDYPQLIEKNGGKIQTLDITTGKRLWSIPLKDLGDVQTMHLIATDEYVVLLYSHNKEVKGRKGKKVHYTTRVFDAGGGKLIWQDTQGTKFRSNLDHGEQDLHPALVGNQLIVEPHIYDITTGKVIGEFARGGYGCGTISASSKSLFYRAGNLGTYDMRSKKGSKITSVSRPGCWINMIPASGMLLVPEGSSGCICKFAIQCSMGFVPVAEKEK